MLQKKLKQNAMQDLATQKSVVGPVDMCQRELGVSVGGVDVVSSTPKTAVKLLRV